MKKYKFGVCLVLVSLFLGAVLVMSPTQVSAASPTISNFTLNGSASRVNAPAGSDLVLGWDFNDFNQMTHYVSVRICRPGSNNCGSWSNLSASGVSPADIIDVGSRTSGHQESAKRVGPLLYSRLVASDPALTPFFEMTEKKAYIKICPVNSVGTISAGATCDSSPYFLVKPPVPVAPSPKITRAYFADSDIWSAGSARTINFNYENLTSQISAVTIKICNPTNTSKCTFFDTHYDPSLTGNGNASTTKTLYDKFYQDLDTNGSYYSPYFVKASSLGHSLADYHDPYESVLKACPALTSSDTVPDNVVCSSFFPFYVVEGAGNTNNPKITNVFYHDSSGYGGDWQAGAAKTIYWDYENFNSTIKKVSISLCHPTDDSKCASWTNAPQTAISSADIAPSGGGAVGGQASTPKSTGTNWYDLAGGTGSLAGFFSNRTARIKVCPVNDSNVTPAGSPCSYSPIFTLKAPTVIPSVSVSVTPTAVEVATVPTGSYSSPVRVTWSSNNFPSGSTCSGNYLSNTDGGWVNSGLSLNNSGYKDVKFSKGGNYTFTVTCKTPAGQSYNNSSAAVTVSEISPAVGPIVSNISVQGVSTSSSVWRSGDERNVTWSVSGFGMDTVNKTVIRTVSVNLCNVAGTNCFLWGSLKPADDNQVVVYADPGLQTSFLQVTKLRKIGPLLYDRLATTSTDRSGLLSIFPATKPFQARIKICPTYTATTLTGYNRDARTGLVIDAGTTVPPSSGCSLGPVFTVGPNINNDPSSSFSQPSGQGCFVGDCVCVGGKKARCGSPMTSGASCPLVADCPGVLTNSLSDKMVASVYGLSNLFSGFFSGFKK